MFLVARGRIEPPTQVFQSSARMGIFVALINSAFRKLFGKGIVGGILQSNIRRNQPFMRVASHDSNPPLAKNRNVKKATLGWPFCISFVPERGRAPARSARGIRRPRPCRGVPLRIAHLPPRDRWLRARRAPGLHLIKLFDLEQSLSYFFGVSISSRPLAPSSSSHSAPSGPVRTARMRSPMSQ